MITITLYQNTAERNSLRPALTPVGASIQGTLRDASSLLNIEITFDKDPQNLYKANYMYIQELDRWYHINNVIAFRSNLTKVSCSLDPLYTYYSQILDCPGVIARCESISSNRYLQDNAFSYPVYPGIIRQLFSKSPTDTTLVLMVSSGVQTSTP